MVRTGIGDEEEKEQRASRFGKWKWVIVVVVIIAVIALAYEFYQFNCVFVNPPYGVGGGGCAGGG